MAIRLPIEPEGTKSAGFAAEDFGGALLQAIHRGIFAVDVVADFGFGHGAAHLGRRARDGVAAEVYYAGGWALCVKVGGRLRCGLRGHGEAP